MPIPTRSPKYFSQCFRLTSLAFLEGYDIGSFGLRQVISGDFIPFRHDFSRASRDVGKVALGFGSCSFESGKFLKDLGQYTYVFWCVF